MNSNDKARPQEENAARQQAAAGETGNESPAEEVGATEAEGGQEQDELSRLRAENEELKDKYLRALADLESLRRRLLKEKEEAVKHASGGLARDMLTVCDNLTRAIESVPPERRNEHELLATLLEGVEMTLKEMLNTFERHHIRRIPAQGERFDPNVHEAMFEVPASPEEAGTVVQVIQEGYTHHDRVLRPARVGVAKADGQQADGQPGGNNAGGGAG